MPVITIKWKGETRMNKLTCSVGLVAVLVFGFIIPSSVCSESERERLLAGNAGKDR